jgi:ABC-type Fe3+/spermidine/putrescine transport system ATPase subunit
MVRETSCRTLLEVRGLAKRFRADRPPVFSGIDLVLGPGEYVAIMGESGVGKSTLLNLLAGLDRADAGASSSTAIDVGALDDDDATLLRRRRMGFVFQAFHMLPYLTVAQNVALPLELLEVAADERDARVARRCSMPSGSRRCGDALAARTLGRRAAARRDRARAGAPAAAAARRRADRQSRSAQRGSRCSRCCASRCTPCRRRHPDHAFARRRAHG